MAIHRGALAWNEEQIEDIVLIGGENPEVCAWAATRLPLIIWLTDYYPFFFYETASLADIYAPSILLIQNRTSRHRLLAQFSASYAIGRLRLIPNLCFILSEPGESEARARALTLDRARARAGDAPPRPPEWLADDTELATLVMRAEWLSGYPDCPKDEFRAHVRRLEELAKAPDDWTRLLGLTSLMLIGEGTPERCQERNELLDRGMKKPKSFTFPRDVQEATDTKEFRRELPQLLQHIFLHEPGDPWIKPEWFDPSHPAARFFRAHPREFYARAAEVLDPEGETELSKWRDKK